jgi:hypothetical protein
MILEPQGGSVSRLQWALPAVCLLGLGLLPSCAHPLPRACQDTEQHLEDLRERCRKDDADLQRCVDELANGPARRMAESAAGLGAGAEADDVLAEIGRIKDRLGLEADARPRTGVQK